MRIFRKRAKAAASTVASATPAACTAELAECTCPDYCERDHGNE